jgi:hypothetical protein
MSDDVAMGWTKEDLALKLQSLADEITEFEMPNWYKDPPNRMGKEKTKLTAQELVTKAETVVHGKNSKSDVVSKKSEEFIELNVNPYVGTSQDFAVDIIPEIEIVCRNQKVDIAESQKRAEHEKELYHVTQCNSAQRQMCGELKCAPGKEFLNSAQSGMCGELKCAPSKEFLHTVKGSGKVRDLLPEDFVYTSEIPEPNQADNLFMAVIMPEEVDNRSQSNSGLNTLPKGFNTYVEEGLGKKDCPFINQEGNCQASVDIGQGCCNFCNPEAAVKEWEVFLREMKMLNTMNSLNDQNSQL